MHCTLFACTGDQAQARTEATRGNRRGAVRAARPCEWTDLPPLHPHCRTAVCLYGHSSNGAHGLGLQRHPVPFLIYLSHLCPATALNV